MNVGTSWCLSRTRQGTVYSRSDISEAGEERIEAGGGVTELSKLLVEDHQKRDKEIAVQEKEWAEEQKNRDEELREE